MIFLKLFCCALIYIFAMASAIDENLSVVQPDEFKYRLSDYVLPLHYDIYFNIEKDILYNDFNIKIYIFHTLQYINFIALNSMNTMEVNLWLTNNKKLYVPKSHVKGENVFFKFNDVILPGFYNLFVNFHISINSLRDFFETLYTNEKSDKGWLIAVGIQPRKIQRIFSFWRSELKATYNISIAHNKKYNALSNMPIRDSELLSNDMMLTFFHGTPSMSIDNVAFMVSNLHQIIFSKTVSVWCRMQVVPYVKFALYIAENVMAFLKNHWNNSEDIFGRTFLSFETKVDYVIIPNCQDEIKQTLGFVFLKEEDIIYNEEFNFTVHKLKIARFVVREIAQKYLGNLFHSSFWLDIWLNEGFTMFLQTYVIDKTLPDFRMIDLFVVQVQQECLYLNTHFAIKPATVHYNSYSEVHLFSFLSHVKGSILWHMLERIMPSDAFSMAINMYFEKQLHHSNATTSDNLWIKMQTAMGASYSMDQFNVKRLIYTWATQKHYPLLQVIRNYTRNVATISLHFQDELDKKYYLPVTFTIGSYPDFNITSSLIWLTSPYSKEIHFDEDKWVIFNLQQVGYYRVNYDYKNWRRIAHYLSTDNYTNIHVLNRAQIIDDAFHLAIENKLDFSVFWVIINYLSREKDYVAWYPMIRIFEYMSNMFAFPKTHLDEDLKEILEKMQNIFKYLETQTYDDTNVQTKDLDKSLKQELAKWECIIHDVTCKVMAKHQLEYYLINPKKNKLLPAWRKWVYCNSLKTASYKIWFNVWMNFEYKIYDEKFELEIFESLGCSKNPENVLIYLQIIIPTLQVSMLESYESNLEARKEEHAQTVAANIFLSTLAKHANNGEILKKVLKNFHKLKYRQVSITAVIIVIINNVYSTNEFDEINEFVKNYTESISILAVQHKISKRLSEINNQIKFFQTMFYPK